VAPVEVERLTHHEIRSGSWRRDGASAPPPSGDPAPLETSPAAVPGAAGFWIQLGAFRQRDGAIELQRRAAQQLSGLAPLLAIFEDGSLHRLQAGPFENRDDAERLSQQVREGLRLTPMLIERR
jgi:rare lipoprotein A